MQFSMLFAAFFQGLPGTILSITSGMGLPPGEH